MKCSFVIATCLTVALSSATVADGLVYKLPKDGAEARFAMTFTMEAGDESRTAEGHLAVRSVGKGKNGDEACRWVEFEMAFVAEGEERTVIAKCLIPEAELAKGKAPISSIRKCWFDRGAGAEDLDDPAGQAGSPLPVFLSGPLSEPKKLEKTKVKTKAGEFECEGLSGSGKFEQGEAQVSFTQTVRLNEKAPFGVVSSKMDVDFTRGGETRTVRMEFTLESTKADATAKVPQTN